MVWVAVSEAGRVDARVVIGLLNFVRTTKLVVVEIGATRKSQTTWRPPLTLKLISLEVVRGLLSLVERRSCITAVKSVDVTSFADVAAMSLLGRCCQAWLCNKMR